MRILAILLFCAGGCLPRFALADGCFVFKWNKDVDIKEPTQKAIIVYDEGREDLLLQVKYEGPLEEFGWLIPVPSLPKVEKGSMEPFYELSRLTQQRFGVPGADQAIAASLGRGPAQPVRVLEIKTVGAYEVAILSPRDPGSLATWLHAHDYQVPEGAEDLIGDYIHRGWYFVAARINVKHPVGFRLKPEQKSATAAASKSGDASIRAKLSSGELHPLLISFDAPQAIFPLKISAAGGKPTEVSLYILSRAPLLSGLIFNQDCAKLMEQRSKWATEAPDRARQRREMARRTQLMGLSFRLYSITNRGAARNTSGSRWSVEQLASLVEGELPSMQADPPEDRFWAASGEMLQCLPLTSADIPDCRRYLPRLKRGDWLVTKQVHTFAPGDMQDLKLDPGLAAVAVQLKLPLGAVAVDVLVKLKTNCIPVFLAACKSTNNEERLNALWGIQMLHDPSFDGPLLDLLRDKAPEVRVQAVYAAQANWIPLFGDAVLKLLRDPDLQVRRAAAGCLSQRENADRAPVYLALLRDPDPGVRLTSLWVASWLYRYAEPEEVVTNALAMLKDPDQNVQLETLHVLFSRLMADRVPRADILPLLRSSRADIVLMAMTLIEKGSRARLARAEPAGSFDAEPSLGEELSSEEAAPLTTNRLGLIRLRVLDILERNADTGGVDLTLPMLLDTNDIVRWRAFTVMRSIAGQNLSESDPETWRQWWATHKTSFKSARTGP